VKIGALLDVSNNASYRGLAPLDALAKRGHEIVVVQERYGAPLRPAPLFDCDVVHVYRWSAPVAQKCVDELRKRGIAVTWDNDDDPRLSPPESPMYKKLGGFRSERTFREEVKMMRRAQVVTTTCEHLANRYREVQETEVAVIENYLADGQFARGRRNDKDIVIGWVASGEHRADVQHLDITNMLRAVMELEPRVRVVTIGVKLNLDPSRYTNIVDVPFAQLAGHVREFDIGVAPLADIPMSYARSNVKVKEYAAAGVPWVASRRGPYAELGAKCGGVTVEDDAWVDTLVGLAGARFKRMHLRRRAEAWSKSQHIDRHVEQWESVFARAATLQQAA
jgi:glycosyltransferase involved in cell wall biosynthesis